MDKSDIKGEGLKWQLIDIEKERTTASIKFCRARVASGWLVRASWDEGMTMTFVRDTYNTWVV